VVYLQRINISSVGIIILICIGLILPSLDVSQDFFEENQKEDAFQIAEDLNILSNEDWETQGWPGNGTQSSPYLVENRTLTDFAIVDSDVFFVVQNCLINNQAFLFNCANGQVRDCVSDQEFDIEYCNNFILSNVTSVLFYMYNCSDSTLSNLSVNPAIEVHSSFIVVLSSENVTIMGCDGEKCKWGIELIHSFNCIVQNNTFTNCGYYANDGSGSYIGGGILTESCVGGIIKNNNLAESKGLSFSIYGSESVEIIENYGNSAYLRDCTNCNVINNTLNTRLRIDGSLNCNIFGNEVGSYGLSVYGDFYGELPYVEYYNHSISNNTLLGKPILYAFRESDTNYSTGEYGQIMIIDSVRVILTKIEVYFQQSSIAVLYSDSCVISQVKSTKIWIFNSARTVIQHCDIIESGISCLNSPETVIHNNTVKDAKFGISIATDSPRALVTYNTVEKVSFYGISIISPECRVENNTIAGGITTMAACYQTTTTRIVNFTGISISSSDCHIVNNTVINNNGFGIYVRGNRNTIYGNTIAGNSLGNGYSNGEDNQWDNGIDTGNVWGDWSGIGVYNVPGEEGCVDNFPNGYANNSTVVGISLSSIVILTSSLGCIIIILIVVTKIQKKAE